MDLTAVNTTFNIPIGPLQKPIEPLRSSTGLSEDSIDAANRAAAAEHTSATGDSGHIDNLSSDAKELLAMLAQKLQERSDISINVSVTVNVIKARLGLQLSELLANSDSDTLSSLLTGNLSGLQTQDADPNVRERLFAALATAGLDDGLLFNDTGTLTNGNNSSIAGALSSGQSDGRDLLFGLLVNELETSEDDAIEILRTFQESRFEIVV